MSKRVSKHFGPKKVFQRVVDKPIRGIAYIFAAFSMELSQRLLRWWFRRLGVDLGKKGKNGYIDIDVKLDSWDYGLIHIGENAVVSSEVRFLTHDYSVDIGLIKRGEEKWHAKILKPIRVGNNSFIGTRVLLLPGATIGKNCIIGAGSTVKGDIPDGSVAAGNPAKVIKTIDEYTDKILQNEELVFGK